MQRALLALAALTLCEAHALSPSVALYSAGYLGALAPGVGLRTETLIPFSAHLLYGYVPPRLAGRAIHALSLEARAHAPALPLSGALSWSPLYLSLATTRGLGAGLFSRSPERYPPNYYHSTAYHLMAGFGTGINLGDLALGLGFAFLDSVVEARAHDGDWGRLAHEGALAFSLHWRPRQSSGKSVDRGTTP